MVGKWVGLGISGGIWNDSFAFSFCLSFFMLCLFCHDSFIVGEGMNVRRQVKTAKLVEIFLHRV